MESGKHLPGDMLLDDVDTPSTFKRWPHTLDDMTIADIRKMSSRKLERIPSVGPTIVKRLKEFFGHEGSV